MSKDLYEGDKNSFKEYLGSHWRKYKVFAGGIFEKFDFDDFKEKGTDNQESKKDKLKRTNQRVLDEKCVASQYPIIKRLEIKRIKRQSVLYNVYFIFSGDEDNELDCFMNIIVHGTMDNKVIFPKNEDEFSFNDHLNDSQVKIFKKDLFANICKDYFHYMLINDF